MTPHEIYLRKIGANIRKGRIAKIMKQEHLGKEVDLSKSEISRIENGKRGPGLAMIWKIAIAIGVPASSLLDE
jgi:transcriptional regulator with XRE-family HTH domain